MHYTQVVTDLSPILPNGDIIGLQLSSLEDDGCMELVLLAPGKDFGNE